MTLKNLNYGSKNKKRPWPAASITASHGLSFNSFFVSLIVPYITLITSKPHIRFPKFTYVDEKFLGELGSKRIGGVGNPSKI